MTSWPKGWRPANPGEAQEYLDAHVSGGGDAEVLKACCAVLDDAWKHRGRSAPIPGGGRTTQSPYVSDEPPATD